jgi:hypothetical protein
VKPKQPNVRNSDVADEYGLCDIRRVLTCWEAFAWVAPAPLRAGRSDRGRTITKIAGISDQNAIPNNNDCRVSQIDRRQMTDARARGIPCQSCFATAACATISSQMRGNHRSHLTFMSRAVVGTQTSGLSQIYIADSYGFNSRDLSNILRIVAENRDLILKAWHEHFAN